MYKASRQYLTVSVTALVIATLFLLTAIFIRSVVTPEIDGKMGADRSTLELRRSLP